MSETANMSTMTSIQGSILARGAAQEHQAVLVPSNFNIQPIDELDTLTAPNPQFSESQAPAFKFELPRQQMTLLRETAPTTPLPAAPTAAKTTPDVLTKLQGLFKGNGFNMIFRPGVGRGAENDNFLEYNVTEETMQFLNVLDQIPNRGLGPDQPDVFLRAVPYTQIVKDMLNHETGLCDLKNGGIDIHFEQGLLIVTPPTKVPLVDKPTISRLASIPHGTTIHCQGMAPDMMQPKTGMPAIGTESIAPFFTQGGSPVGFQFPTMDFSKKNDLRLPKDVSPFTSKQTLNTQTMNNPNQALVDVNKLIVNNGGVFKDHVTFSVSSKDPKIPGGGTANIGFLSGSDLSVPSKGNASAVKVTTQYWISTVEYEVLLPAGDFSGANKRTNQIITAKGELLSAEAANTPVPTAGVGKTNLKPTFVIDLNSKINPGQKVKIPTTQIQYSQNVTLDFNNVSWPHISVATLFQQAVRIGEAGRLLR